MVTQGWGLTVVLGIHATPEMLPIHPMELFDGRRIVASVFGGFKGRTQIPLFAKQCLHGVRIIQTSFLFFIKLVFPPVFLFKKHLINTLINGAS